MAIPIENIYYLLCYAWDTLEQKEQVRVSPDEDTQLLDLFAKVLINGTHVLLKRGIEKNYVNNTVELAGVKGKLEMSPTLKSGIYLKQRTICTIDEFSGNILSNQILISTLYRLISTRELSNDLKKQLKSLLWRFSGIEPVELTTRVFNTVRLHRNNRFYVFLLRVCRIIFDHTLPSEKPGQWLFVDFMRDEHKMNRLFESFLLNFYKKHFPQWGVRSEHLFWNFEVANASHRDFLPRMITDISINTPEGKIIIDAKYYKEALSGRFDKQTIQSGNLYQLFSYLLNQRGPDPRSQKTKGILLYPTTNQELNLHYLYQGHPIEIKTVNLNTHWKAIEKRLKEIVQVFG